MRIALLVCLAALAGSPQQPIRVNVKLINVGFTVRDAAGRLATNLDKEDLNALNKYDISVMERIARETGGADFDARSKSLADNFREIGDQLRSSYELAYHTTNPVADGTFHKISIRLKKPGLSVRAKTGYLATGGECAAKDLDCASQTSR